MQGIMVNGNYPLRKKTVGEAIRRDPDKVVLVATSSFGGEHDGPITTMPVGSAYVAGPDPEHKRDWYGTLTRKTDGTFIWK